LISSLISSTVLTSSIGWTSSLTSSVGSISVSSIIFISSGWISFTFSTIWIFSIGLTSLISSLLSISFLKESEIIVVSPSITLESVDCSSSAKVSSTTIMSSSLLSKYFSYFSNKFLSEATNSFHAQSTKWILTLWDFFGFWYTFYYTKLLLWLMINMIL